MITTSDFKKQISKPFGRTMREYGFKGSGFDFFQETEEFLIAVYLVSGRWGHHCSAGLAIHPKQIEKDHNGKLDTKRLKIYQYEFKLGLMACNEWWNYSDDESVNANTLTQIISFIKEKAFPVIEQFTSNPTMLDMFDVGEMDNFHENWTARTGTSIATTDYRFAWAMAVLFETKNPQKAIQFAKWASGRDEYKDKDWFGERDFERILTRVAVAS